MSLGDLGDLLRQLEERSRDSGQQHLAGPGAHPSLGPLESRFVVGPSDRPTTKALGVSYAGASVFLYQLLIGFALTNGTFVFFTSGNSSLRPFASFALVESALFVLFVAAATLRVLDFIAAMPHNS
ncbi:MAG TPA: hypothetical protein VH393_01045, partial [Ktedonobacterales bacterium]